MGSQLAKALDIGQLVPEAYAAYRPLVADAFLFFLGHLSGPRLAGILDEQARIPADTPLAARVVALMRHCPTLHKLGQVVARDRRLGPDLRRRLQGLESLPPVTATPDLLAALGRHVASAVRLAAPPLPLAEGSVAVVVAFTWQASAAAPPREGVLKALKPKVEERLQEELAIWPRLGTYLEERSAHYALPVLEYVEILDRVRALLLNEVRLDLEQAHLGDAARFYADCPAVLIPRLLPFSTARITAMERIRGCKAPEVAGGSRHRDLLAQTMVDALIAKPFWSETPTATFHADPHAGNLFCTPDGRLAILDWSLVARLTKRQRVAIMQILLGALSLDAARIRDGVLELVGGHPDTHALQTAVARALVGVRGGIVPGFAWLLGLLDRLATDGIVTFPEDLLFFRKALLSLSGVVEDLSADCNIDRLLFRSAGEQFCGEWVGRMLSAPDSRAFGTHVSSADLLGLWTSLPASTVRFWIGVWTDVVAALQHAGQRGQAGDS